VADSVQQGRTRKTAEAEAITRLGPPDQLARALAAAHRRPMHLLAAAGAGTWAALRTGTFGAVLAWLVVGLLSIVASVVGRGVASWLGLPPGTNAGWSDGWNSVLTAAGLAIGGFFAAAAAVRAVVRRGWWQPARVRLAVGIGGGLLLAMLVLGVLELPLNWASVAAMLLVPVAFALGARLEGVHLPPRRATAALMLAILIPGLAISAAVNGRGGVTSFEWDEATHGYEMIAPWWQDPAAGEPADFPTGSSFSAMTGTVEDTVSAASVAVIQQFRDFQLEAWRAEPPGDGWRLIPGQQRPFAVSTATTLGTEVSGFLRFNRTPGVEWAQVVLTATGPDGRRYLLTASGPLPTVFYGSVVDWFAALGG
jgi:hypothetical protein